MDRVVRRDGRCGVAGVGSHPRRRRTVLVHASLQAPGRILLQSSRQTFKVCRRVGKTLLEHQKVPTDRHRDEDCAEQAVVEHAEVCAVALGLAVSERRAAADLQFMDAEFLHALAGRPGKSLNAFALHGGAGERLEGACRLGEVRRGDAVCEPDARCGHAYAGSETQRPKPPRVAAIAAAIAPTTTKVRTFSPGAIVSLPRIAEGRRGGRR